MWYIIFASWKTKTDQNLFENFSSIHREIEIIFSVIVKNSDDYAHFIITFENSLKNDITPTEFHFWVLILKSGTMPR